MNFFAWTWSKVVGKSGTIAEVTAQEALKVDNSHVALPAGSNVLGAVKIADRNTAGRYAAIDGVHDALTTTHILHHECHEGNYFRVGAGGSVNVNQDLDVVFKTGNIQAHLFFSVTGDSAREVFVYEAPTTSENGTLLTSRDFNRVTANTPLATVRKDPTVSAVGTEIYAHELGSKGDVSQSSLREGVEWVLAPNTKYLFRATAGLNQVIWTELEWYEE